MKSGKTWKDDDDVDGLTAVNLTNLKRGLTNSNTDADESQSDSKKTKMETRHTIIDQFFLEFEKNQTISFDRGEIESECQLLTHQPLSNLSEDLQQCNWQPTSSLWEDNTQHAHYTDEKLVILPHNVQSSVLSQYNHNRISNIDPISAALPSTTFIDTGTVAQEKSGVEAKQILNYGDLLDSEAEILDYNWMDRPFGSTFVDQCESDAETDDEFISAPRLSQGIPSPSALHDLSPVQYAQPLQTISNIAEDGEVHNDFTSRHVDLVDSTPSSSNNMQNSGNFESDEFVLRERPDRGAEDLEKILSGLDARQKRAVLIDCERPSIVIAGPGSGKTLVFVRHMAYRIVKIGVRPSSILALTFTNNAAAEMKERLESLLGYSETDVRNRRTRGPIKNIKTIHGFCVQVLREFGYDQGVPKDFKICNKYESLEAIKALLDGQEEPRKSILEKYRKAISMIKTERTKELYNSFAGSQIVQYTKFQRLYDKYLREKKMLDYDDLILETRRLLRDFPDVIASLQKRFKHVFVDEMQDIDDIQCDIIRMLCDGHGRLYAVGDPDQSIYKFRGANPKGIERVAKAIGNTQRTYLSRNYRSSVHIVNVAQAVINQNSDRVNEKMVAKKDGGFNVLLECASDAKEEASCIARDIRDSKNSGEISSYSDCAVLYRKNKESEILTKALAKVGIPYIISKDYSFFGKKEIVDILSLLRVLRSPADDFSVLEIVEVMAPKIGKNRMRNIHKHARQTGNTLLKTLENLTSDPPVLFLDLNESQRKPLRKCVETIHKSMQLYEKMRKKSTDSQSANVGKLLSEISKETEYDKLVVNRERGKQEGFTQYKEKIIQRLIDNASSFENLSEFLKQTDLEHVSTNRKEDKPDAVWLSTIHGSKGLEFEIVFIIGADKIKAKRGGDDDEERRLLYVAITRAKSLLIISWRNAQGRKKKPSKKKRPEYLTNLPDESVNDWIE